MSKRTLLPTIALAAMMVWPSTAPAVPQTTAFTYQGNLASNGSPASGTYAFRLRLFDALSGGTQIQTDQIYPGIIVTNGLFSFTAQFAASSFAGEARWLEVGIKGPGDPDYTTLPQRQPVNSVPYAVRSLNGTAGQWVSDGPDLTYPGGGIGVTGTSAPFASGKGVFLDASTSTYSQVYSYNYDTSQPLSLLLNATGGKVAVNTTNLYGAFTVESNTDAAIVGKHDSNWVGVYGESQSSVGVWGKSTTGIGVQGETGAAYNAGVIGYCSNANGWGGWFQNSAGGVGLHVVGRAEVGTLDIAGGADIVEGFDTGARSLEAGTVVVIDDRHPGELRASTRSYDTRVAGVVSGAGGIAPGLHIGQKGKLDGDTPVAMSGRVYVRCSAENGAIRAGDLLTTSATTGCAMRSSDNARDHGAVLGKAMGTLDHGTGLVLAIVNLQ